MRAGDDVTADERPMFVFVKVEHKEIGEIDVETTSGDTLTEEVLALDLDCLVGTTGARMPITLVVPKSAGYDLLRHLLTEDQLDAATDA